MRDVLEFTATVDITAAKGKRQPAASIIAYTGGPMRPSGFQRFVVIDLDGLNLGNGKIPILSDHDSQVAGIVGSGVAVVRHGQLLVEATLTETTPAGRQIIALAKDGFDSFQASIGASIEASESIDGDTTISINGRQITADEHGLIVARKTTLREVSTHLSRKAVDEKIISRATGEQRKHLVRLPPW